MYVCIRYVYYVSIGNTKYGQHEILKLSIEFRVEEVQLYVQCQYVCMHVRMYVCDSLHILPPKTYVHIILTNVRIRTYVITYYVLLNLAT